MNKQEFLGQLRKGLSRLPQEDVEERLTFYSEMIEDRMEEGLSEEEAVSAAGSAPQIVAQMTAEIPLLKRSRPKRRLNTGELVLLILGSPIWISLGMAALSIILSLYILLWSVMISLWAGFASLAACSVGGVLACVMFTAGGKGASGAAVLAAGIVCAGLSIFMFYGCREATKGILILTKKTAIWMKHCLIEKEDA